MALVLAPDRPRVRSMPPVSVHVRDVIRIHDALDYDGAGLDILVDDAYLAESPADLLDYEKPSMASVTLTRRQEPKICLRMSSRRTSLEVPPSANTAAAGAAVSTVRLFCEEHARRLLFGSRTPANVIGMVLIYLVLAVSFTLIAMWVSTSSGGQADAASQLRLGLALWLLAPVAFAGLHLARAQRRPPVTMVTRSQQRFTKKWGEEINILLTLLGLLAAALPDLL